MHCLVGNALRTRLAQPCSLMPCYRLAHCNALPYGEADPTNSDSVCTHGHYRSQDASDGIQPALAAFNTYMGSGTKAPADHMRCTCSVQLSGDSAARHSTCVRRVRLVRPVLASACCPQTNAETHHL